MPNRIAFISPSDPNDKDPYSGIIYYIFKNLKKLGEVIYLDHFKIKYYLHLKIINRISRYYLKKDYNYAFSVRNSKRAGSQLTKTLAGNRFNLIFAPYGCMQIAFIETNIPIIYLSDATFKIMIDYYPDFSHPLSQREGNLLEQRAIRKARKLIYPSEWAAQSAIKDYGAPPEKVHVIPFGANLEGIPPIPANRGEKGKRCNLLFIGKDWQRKGGELVLAALEKLEGLGIPAQLTIVGCQPPGKFPMHNIRVIPYLNKNQDQDARLLEQLFFEADFFVLPTRADASSIVAAEANAFGLPVISTYTGGLLTIIREGINGYLLPLTARGEDFAKVIATVFRDEKKYLELRATSRKEYENRLNWEVWTERVADVIAGALK
jgi:glycosyltransferase involved in cell wall biosynthesis